MAHKRYKEFYENIDRESVYTPEKLPEQHGAYNSILSFINRYDLSKKKILEAGASKGLFQDLVGDYTGLDIAESLTKHFHKPYVCLSDDGIYPFKDNTFDAVWTWKVFEHIPDIDTALKELCRVVKPGGYVLFSPAWQCRPWAAEGYPVRPYSDFGLSGKLIKASIPLRNSLAWRISWVLPKRIFRHIFHCLGYRLRNLPTRQLQPNYSDFWMSDSDAVHSIDPHDAILWFEANGFECVNQPLHLKALTVRTGDLVFRKSS